MFKTLEEVLNYYNSPDWFIDNPINRDDALKTPLRLTIQEKKDIIAFLNALTDKRFIKRR